MRSPRRMTRAPINVIVLRPGPGPVKARELEGAVTTRAVEDVDEADFVAGAVEVVDFGVDDVVLPEPACVVDVAAGVDVDVEVEVEVPVPDDVVVVIGGVEVVVVGRRGGGRRRRDRWWRGRRRGTPCGARDHRRDLARRGDDRGDARGRHRIVGVRRAREHESVARHGQRQAGRRILLDGYRARGRRESGDGGGGGRQRQRHPGVGDRARDGDIEGERALGHGGGSGAGGIDLRGGRSSQLGPPDGRRRARRAPTGGSRSSGIRSG